MTTAGRQEGARAAPAGSPLHPVFLKLAGRKVVVVGGGRVAAGKVRSLLEAGARVVVVAPDVTQEMAGCGTIVERRQFEPQDLDGAWYVVAAATPEVNREVRCAADERRLFVNAVDDPETASAYAGAVLRKNVLTIAISTEGRAPALAGLVREGLEELVPDDFEAWAEESRVCRSAWKAAGVPIAERRPRLLEALNRRYGRRPPKP